MFYIFQSLRKNKRFHRVLVSIKGRGSCTSVKLKSLSLKTDPCQRSETQTPLRENVSLLPRKVNACGTGDGTGPPSRPCAPSHTGRLSCVTDDTAHRGQTTRPLRDSANLHACVIVHVALWPCKAGNSRIPSTHARSDFITGKRREPARKNEH